MVRKQKSGAPLLHSPQAGVAERILETANELFYREGIQAVGIQRLIDEAGIAKASLYAHFASKDDVVAAYLEKRGAAWREHVRVNLEKLPRGKARLLGLFDLVAEWIAGPDFCGCPFQKLDSEIAEPSEAIVAVTRRHRSWVKGLLENLVRAAGHEEVESLAGALRVLFDGAAATAMVDDDRQAGFKARWAAERLLEVRVA
jgi:AcrR family transcriptional regulator